MAEAACDCEGTTEVNSSALLKRADARQPGAVLLSAPIVWKAQGEGEQGHELQVVKARCAGREAERGAATPRSSNDSGTNSLRQAMISTTQGAAAA